MIPAAKIIVGPIVHSFALRRLEILRLGAVAVDAGGKIVAVDRHAIYVDGDGGNQDGGHDDPSSTNTQNGHEQQPPKEVVPKTVERREIPTTEAYCQELRDKWAPGAQCEVRVLATGWGGKITN